MMRSQRGYFLLLAVMFVLAIGLIGVIVSYTYSTRANVTVAQQGGLQAFYVAESGFEIAARSLLGGQGVTCDTLTGTPSLTNASVLNGTFTAIAVSNALYSAATTLSASITSNSNSLSVASTAGMAAHGRVRIDSEAIDYATISGTTLLGLNRGAAGTTAASHDSGAAVSESVCLVNVKAGIPTVASPTYQRELEMAVEILTGSDMWAVGTRHGNEFTIIRWLNDSWKDNSYADNSNRENLNAISMSSPTNGWAVGRPRGSNFTFVHWNGTTWTPSPVSIPIASSCSQELRGVNTISATEAWAVGLRYRPNCASNGAYRYDILKWNGASWSALAPATIPVDSTNNQNLQAISMIDTNNDGVADFGFAVGDAGTILRYSGDVWTTSSSGVTTILYGVNVVSTTEAWAVGANGRILHWNGLGWSFTTPTAVQLNAISMVDANHDGVAEAGWAVGNNGVILYYNGSTWTAQASGTTKNLNAVLAISASSAYAVGTSKKLLQYTNGTWSTLTYPSKVSSDYRGIAGTGGVLQVTGTQVGSWQQIFR